MPNFQLLSAIEQVAQHLRGELARGRWQRTMPGVYQLVEDLGVSRSTVEGALQLLEKEGLLMGQGAGKRRQIAAQRLSTPRGVKLEFVLYDENCRRDPNVVEIQHRLLQAGFEVSFASPTLQQLDMNKTQVVRMLRRSRADCWVIRGGTREILTWCSQHKKPTFAMFGGFSGLPVSGVTAYKISAMGEAVQRLVELGHRRIVMLSSRERLLPEPLLFERRFLEALNSHGIETSSYNLPLWHYHAEGFQLCLDKLWQVTPPTALIMEEPYRFHAAKDHLAAQGIVAPRDVSLVCADPDPSFMWHRPQVSHIDWDGTQVVKRVVAWARKVARGRPQPSQTSIKTKFVVGGTIGPVPVIDRQE